MKRYLMLPSFVVALILFFNHVSFAQYTAIGIRAGGTTGVTFKHAYRPSMTFEGIVGGFGNGFSVTGLIEKNTRAFGQPGLNWYYGAGAHVAVYNGRRNYRWREIDDRADNDVGFGINGIIGSEYRLPDNVPLAFSVDLKPFIEITTDGYAGFALDPSIGVKFILR